MAVYFIRNSRTCSVKIGKSDNPRQRLSDLQTGNEDPLEIILELPGAEMVEQQLHAYFDGSRIRGEWFKETPELLETMTNLRVASEVYRKYGDAGHGTYAWLSAADSIRDGDKWLKLWLMASGIYTIRGKHA